MFEDLRRDLHPLLTTMAFLRQRLRAAREDRAAHPDAGYSTEAALVTALLAALGLGVVGIIAVKVTSRAQSINLGP